MRLRLLQIALLIAFVFVFGPRAAAQGQPTPAGQLQARIQALEQKVAGLQTDLTGFKTELETLSHDLQSLGGSVGDVSGQLAALQTRVAALESALAAGPFQSYDQLAGVPCTNAMGTTSTVKLVGAAKTAMCGVEAISKSGRFLDYGLVILDTTTNLLWEKKTTSGKRPHDVNTTYAWLDANHWVLTMLYNGGFGADYVFAGFNDWRLPTVDELVGILTNPVGNDIVNYYCAPGGCIDPIFGPTVSPGENGEYWSSTPPSGYLGCSSGDPCGVNFNSYSGVPVNRHSASDQLRVRMVRNVQ